LLPAVFQSYVPMRWGEVPSILFGLGAIAVAQHPEGTVVQNGRQLRRLVARALSGASTRDSAPDPGRGDTGGPIAPAVMGTALNAEGAP